MITSCPTCGGEVEFRYDDSFVRVCGHCRSAVVRTDRGVDTLGRVADLMPSSSPLSLWLEGRLPIPGATGVARAGLGFMLIGRAQIRHGAGGTWEEWYAKFDDGRWGWVAEAQGRFYVTFETIGAGDELPSFDELVPGERITLDDDGPRSMAVAEKGEAEYLACDGEIPYRFIAGSRYHFADLGDGSGRFATIDYGRSDVLDDHPPPPKVYLGRQVTLTELGWANLDAAVAARPSIKSGKLACPQCDGSLELRAPDHTMRIACPYCESLLDVNQGALKLLHAKPPGSPRGAARPMFPLGAKATFDGVQYTLIGFVRRHAIFDGMRYPFDEYLLYQPQIGFRWLVESDGHWSFVTTLPPGAVGGNVGDDKCEYARTNFKLFQRCALEVASVYGEVYWKVTAGETVYGSDYVAAPSMLSCEEGPNEVNWSLGVYLKPREVKKAFGDFGASVEMPSPVGIAPNQPFKHKGIGTASLLGVLAAVGIAALVMMNASGRVVTREQFLSVGSPDPELVEVVPGTNIQVFFTEPFQLRARENVEIHISTSLDNEWMALGVDLVNVETGAFENTDLDLEYWSGVTDGESWTEGAKSGDVHIGAMPAGNYVVRLEVMRDPTKLDVGREVKVVVRQDVFRIMHVLLVLGFVCVPGLLFALWGWSYERRRWKNSDHAPAGMTSDDDDSDY